MIPEMIKKNIANKMNDSKKNDFYEMEKCSKWIDAHNLNKVCIFYLCDDCFINSKYMIKF